MNISIAGKNHALHYSNSFENRAANAQSGNSQNFAKFISKSAASVSISPEAQALREAHSKETEEVVKTKSFSLGDELYHKITRFASELMAEAYKNGTSMETALKEHGMEIAEYLAKKEPGSSDEEFLEGVARCIEGQSYKDAFKDACNLDDNSSRFVERKFDLEESFLKMAREHYYKLKRMFPNENIYCGVYSERLGGNIFPPDKMQDEEAVKQDEEVVKPDEDDNEDVPNDDAAQQDVNAFFRDFAKRMRASFKNGVESNLRHTANRENNILNEYVKISKTVKKKGSGISKEHIKTGKKYT